MSDSWKKEAAGLFSDFAKLVQKEQSLLEQKQLLFHKLANVLDDACADDDDDSSGKRKREEDEVKVEAKDEDEKGKKKKAKKEKYLGPKRATTAYALFCKDSFAKGKEIGIQEDEKPFTIIGRMWAALAAEEKQVYEGKAAKDIIRYTKDLKEYHEKFPELATVQEKKFLATDPEQRKKLAKVSKEAREKRKNSAPKSPSKSAKSPAKTAPESPAKTATKQEKAAAVPSTPTSEKVVEGGDPSAKKKKKKKAKKSISKAE